MNSALEYTRDVELKGATPHLVLHSDPRSMGGVKRFPGTRVPVSYLFADMADGVSIEEFCRRHSRVKLEDCRAVVNCAMELVELRKERAIEREQDDVHPRQHPACYAPQPVASRDEESARADPEPESRTKLSGIVAGQSASHGRMTVRVLTQVTPTAEQLPVLADDGRGFRLIRGAAGSGKTTVALLRLRQLCASRVSRHARLDLAGHVRVLVLTFNRTLRAYIAQLVDEGALSDPQHVHLEIDTFGRWAQTLVGPLRVVGDRRRHAELERLLLETRVPTVAANLPYFVDEVEYIVGRFERANRPAYLAYLAWSVPDVADLRR